MLKLTLNTELEVTSNCHQVETNEGNSTLKLLVEAPKWININVHAYFSYWQIDDAFRCPSNVFHDRHGTSMVRVVCPIVTMGSPLKSNKLEPETMMLKLGTALKNKVSLARVWQISG